MTSAASSPRRSRSRERALPCSRSRSASRAIRYALGIEPGDDERARHEPLENGTSSPSGSGTVNRRSLMDRIWPLRGASRQGPRQLEETRSFAASTTSTSLASATSATTSTAAALSSTRKTSAPTPASSAKLFTVREVARDVDDVRAVDAAQVLGEDGVGRLGSCREIRHGSPRRRRSAAAGAPSRRSSFPVERRRRRRSVRPPRRTVAPPWSRSRGRPEGVGGGCSDSRRRRPHLAGPYDDDRAVGRDRRQRGATPVEDDEIRCEAERDRAPSETFGCGHGPCQPSSTPAAPHGRDTGESRVSRWSDAA